MKKYLALTLITGLLLAACTAPNTDNSAAENGTTASSSPLPSAEANFPDEITFTQAGLFPEGIDYDATCDCFLVSSISKGTVGKVDREGKYTPLVEDEDNIGAIGLYVDAPRDRLLVALSDNGASPKSSEETQRKMAKLGIYELSSGTKIATVDLASLKPGAHFANDIAVDASGHVYVTDSFSSVIYQVNPNNEASIFLDSDELMPSEGAFGSNGIVFHPEGYLIVAKAENKALYKVMLSDKSIQEIPLDAPLPASPDGLELISNDRLVVVSNAESTVTVLSSSNNFASAVVNKQTKLEATFPTTAAHIGTDVFVLEAKLGMASEGESITDYRIIKVDGQK